MRKLCQSIAVIALLVTGFACGRYRVAVVHAQQSGQTFTCQASNTGSPSVQCSQYLLQVDSQRGYPKFQVFQVQTQPILIDGSNGSTFANVGSGATVSVQAFELATGTKTFTLSATEP